MSKQDTGVSYFYTATFSDGRVLTRTSKRANYTHAYRAVDGIGQTNEGFASSEKLANSAMSHMRHLAAGWQKAGKPAGRFEVVAAVRS